MTSSNLKPDKIAFASVGDEEKASNNLKTREEMAGAGVEKFKQAPTDGRIVAVQGSNITPEQRAKIIGQPIHTLRWSLKNTDDFGENLDETLGEAKKLIDWGIFFKAGPDQMN